MSLKNFLVQPIILTSYYRKERDGLVSESGIDCLSETLNSHFGFAPDSLCGLNVVFSPPWFVVIDQIKSRLDDLKYQSTFGNYLRPNGNCVKFWQTYKITPLIPQ